MTKALIDTLRDGKDYQVEIGETYQRVDSPPEIELYVVRIVETHKSAKLRHEPPASITASSEYGSWEIEVTGDWTEHDGGYTTVGETERWTMLKFAETVVVPESDHE